MYTVHTHKLQLFHNIVNYDIPDFIARDCKLHELLFFDVKVVTQKEIVRVKSILNRTQVKLSKNKERLIACTQKYRKTLIELIIKLENYLSPNRKTGIAISKDGARLCRYMHQTTKDLLIFIDSKFPECSQPCDYVSSNLGPTENHNRINNIDIALLIKGSFNLEPLLKATIRRSIQYLVLIVALALAMLHLLSNSGWELHLNKKVEKEIDIHIKKSAH